MREDMINPETCSRVSREVTESNNKRLITEVKQLIRDCITLTEIYDNLSMTEIVSFAVSLKSVITLLHLIRHKLTIAEALLEEIKL